MYYLVLLFAAVVVMSEGRSTRVKRNVEIITEIENDLESSVLAPSLPNLKKIPKQLLESPRIYVREAGSIIELKCEVLGMPAPFVHWFRNDEPMYQHELEVNKAVDVNPTSLARISSTLLLPRSLANARYTCLVPGTPRLTRIVVNADPASTETTGLSEHSKLFPLAPRIVVYYKAFVDVLGSRVVLPCHMRGHPRPHAVWFNKNERIRDDDPRFKVLKSGALEINPLITDDLGDFTCHATNIFGTASVKTFVYAAASRENGQKKR